MLEGADDILVIGAPTLVAAELLVEVLDTGGYGTSTRSPMSPRVKGNLLAGARAWGGEFPPRLVLGHPIAGSERSGVEASRRPTCSPITG